MPHNLAHCRKGRKQAPARFPISLAHIKDLDRAKHGNLNFFFLCDDLSVFIQNRSLGIRVQFLLLDFLLIWCGSNDGNTMLALFYMTLKLVFPLIVSGYQCSVRLLHIDCLLYTSKTFHAGFGGGVEVREHHTAVFPVVHLPVYNGIGIVLHIRVGRNGGVNGDVYKRQVHYSPNCWIPDAAPHLHRRSSPVVVRDRFSSAEKQFSQAGLLCYRAS